MVWQDFVFMAGSLLSVAFLYPTLRNAAARVPRATSVPSMLIGGAYSFTFFTLGMRFSALGAFAACTMWSLIVWFRAPESTNSVTQLTNVLDAYVLKTLQWQNAVRRADPRYRDPVSNE